jgi:pimeloyl-ACP methyl ester carboxylesterase
VSAPPSSLQTLVARYDPAAFEPQRGSGRVRLAVVGSDSWDAVMDRGKARLASAKRGPDATLTATERSWSTLAQDLRGGIDAFRSGRLGVRGNLHVGVGFLAATSALRGPGRLRFRMVATRRARLSTFEAGSGPPVVALHGLGATKGSFLPTAAELGERFRVIAVDLPGFGDSDKPIGASYDARFFARAVIDLLDTLELDRVHLVGNSLGGRIALEIGVLDPDRVDRLALLCPALAWRRERRLAPLFRLARPELGLVQLAPRALVEAIVRRLIPGADEGWTAAGVDEFLRAYLTPAGRAAFYASARQIYLDEPHGDDGFWPRLGGLEPDALFVWGRHDRLVPVAFARHVTAALPHSRHIVLDCGHVPQIERPRRTHQVVGEFLGEAALDSPAANRRAKSRPPRSRRGRASGEPEPIESQ